MSEEKLIYIAEVESERDAAIVQADNGKRAVEALTECLARERDRNHENDARIAELEAERDALRKALGDMEKAAARNRKGL